MFHNFGKRIENAQTESNQLTRPLDFFCENIRKGFVVVGISQIQRRDVLETYVKKHVYKRSFQFIK